MRIKSEEKLEKEESFQTTDYVYSHRGDVLLEDTDSSDGKTSYVYAFEKTFARVDGTVTPGEEMDTTYFHHDTTDSTRLMTDADGEVTMDQDYLPFGGDLPGAGKNAVVNKDEESYKYTGQKEVVSIGLYYYGARYYDSGTGRFTTRDAYRGELKNPQSLNLYVYVMNNPLRYTDPTGYMAVDGEDVTVESDETLEDIAIELYGDKEAAKYLAQENDLENINVDLEEGQVLYAPEAINTAEASYERLDSFGSVKGAPDLFIGSTVGLTAGLQAGGLATIKTGGSAVASTASGALDKVNYWCGEGFYYANKGLQYVSKKYRSVKRLFSGSEPSGSSANVSNQSDIIKTDYGDATQATTEEALKLKNGVSNRYVYRAGEFGRSKTIDAQFWAPENPLSTPGYANKYGVDFKNVDYIIREQIKDNSEFITRYAPGLKDNVGGALEVVTEKYGVKIESFIMP